MTPSIRRIVLRADAVFLLVAATWGMFTDLTGAFLGTGPIGKVVGPVPHAAIGFVEAHGLAFIIGVLLWRAESARLWHFTGMAVHVLLGTCNLVFWPLFAFAGMIAGGYITTTLHWLLVALQFAAALAASPSMTKQV